MKVSQRNLGVRVALADREGVYSIHQKFTFDSGVSVMARVDLFAKIPLIGMTLVFLAMAIVAVTAYLHAGWYSIIGYAIAAVVAVSGFVMTFRDVSDTPDPPERWDARGNPVDPASPGTD